MLSQRCRILSNRCFNAPPLRRFISIYRDKLANRKQKMTGKDKALEYFDNFYKPIYGEKWPSIRVSLLSQSKYCALANNFCNIDKTELDLEEAGGINMLHLAANTPPCEFTLAKYTRVDKVNASKELQPETEPAGEEQRNASEFEDIPGVVTADSDLYEFVPPQRVLAAQEEKEEEELQKGFYRPETSHVHVVPGQAVNLPKHLKAFIHDRGEVELFPPIRHDDTGKFTHFMMDAASILPIIALNLQPDDIVLDLCAAPGGKTLAMLQTVLPGKVVCVDSSKSRLLRLENIMQQYIPQSFTQDDKINVLRADGILYCESIANKGKFDKILVDAPCNTDRHMVDTDDNNLFKPGRRSERLGLQDTQLALLRGALRAVKPGGSVVYSTCTLSMPQNDGVIQAALDKIWKTTNIDVVIEDACHIVDSFKDMFDFHPNCRFGQMVIPRLTANCGPMYFCKLRRLE